MVNVMAGVIVGIWRIVTTALFNIVHLGRLDISLLNRNVEPFDPGTALQSDTFTFRLFKTSTRTGATGWYCPFLIFILIFNYIFEIFLGFNNVLFSFLNIIIIYYI